MKRWRKHAAATLGALVCVLAVAAGQSVAAGGGTVEGAAGPFLPGPKEKPYALPPVSAEKVDLEARVSRDEAAKAVSQEAIEAFAREYGVDEETARQRLATQGMVPDVGAVLRLVLGSGYTDVWWDNASGQLVVLATAPVTDAEIADALTERGLTSEDFRIDRVGYSQDDLLAAGQEVTKQLDPLFAKRRYTTALAAGRVKVTLASSSDAEQRGQAREVVDRVSASTGGVPIDVAFAADDAFGAEAPACSNGTRSCDEILAGSRYSVTGGSCSFAFPVYWVGRSPFIPSILTAAHCVNHLPLVSNVSTCRAAGWPCPNVGLTLQYFYGYGRSDWAMIDLYAPRFWIWGGWFNWGPSTYTQLAGRSWYPPPAGYWVCKNGATSGSSCGTVVAYGAWVEQPGARIENLIETSNLRFCRGDSGGPVTSASVEHAVGNVSQVAAYDESHTCSLRRQYAAPIWEPEYYFNVWYLSGWYAPTA